MKNTEQKNILLISKEEFCGYIKVIEEFQKESLNAGDTISKMFFGGSVSSAFDFDFGNDLLYSYIELLAKFFKDPESAKSTINYYLYEDSKKIYVDAGTLEEKIYHLNTSSRLYDYLVEYCS